jgi:HSP20 family protein
MFWNKKRLEPLVDIEDKKNELIVSLELPGVKKKNIHFKIDSDNVEIRAEKEKRKEEKKKRFFRKERKYQNFYKSFSLPSRINPKKAKTKFEKGILTLKLPKLKKQPKKSTIGLIEK